MDAPPVNTQALPAGTRIEDFVIERVLGAGGFGMTYLALDTRLGRKVVIKENFPAQYCFRDTGSLTVAPRHTHGSDADNFQWSLDNFNREAGMLASLDHPGIVRVLGSFEAFGTAYFVMPFVEGETLDQLARSRAGDPFTQDELIGLLEWLLDALSYLHGHGIFHRDIKPGNILVTREGRPVLIDFGSARQQLGERSMTVVESAGYTPFEQLQTRGNVGPWSDLYSLAATVVKVMTGEAPPKANDRTMGDPWQPLAGRGDLKEQYSSEFLHTLDQALRLPIDERWRNADEFKKALKGKSPKVVENLKEREIVPPPVDVTPLPKRNMVAVWMIGLCLGLCALGYGLWEIGKCDVHITSNPPGAEVVQNGKILGRTPFSFDSLSPFSKWQVDLRLKGHESQVIQGSVTWRERTVAPVSQLEALPQKVIITSEPLGAEVLLGEKSLGVTPWESEPIEIVDEISYLLRLPGYNEQLVTARLEVGETSRLNVRLERDKWFALNAPSDVRAQMAEAGDAYAQALLGHDKFFGPKVGMTFEEISARKIEGETWIRKSAEQNHPLGLALLGHFHQSQNCDPDKYEAAKVCYDRAEKHGLISDHNQKDPCWSYYVGRFFEEGYGVSKDVEKAVGFYRDSASHGYALAQFTIGLCYENGVVLEKNIGEALKWICEAAEQGFAAAQLDLGMRCIAGNGLEKDVDEAVRWFTKAADQGHDYAQYKLGVCYAAGIGVAKDEAEAVNWFRKSAEQGISDAQHALGLFYFEGSGVTKDEAKAIILYRKAAEQGHADAQFNLGGCYANGQGVDKDVAEAARWYRKAAEQGVANAQYNLGYCYEYGQGVAKDEAEAVKWYRKSAEQGNAIAQYNLGLCYAEAKGVRKNEPEAARLYRAAAEQGNADALNSLGLCYANGQGVKKDEFEAYKLYRKSSDGGNASAMGNLSICYARGSGVKRNLNKALDLAKQAKNVGLECNDLINAISTLIAHGHSNQAPTSPKTASNTAMSSGRWPAASMVPGKAGFVFSPHNNKVVDVRDIPSGTLVQDPTYPAADGKYFRVP